MGRLPDEVLGDLIARQRKVIIVANSDDKRLIEYTDNILKFLTELWEYRKICDSPEKLKLIDELYLERCEEINRLKAELAEYKKLEEEELLLKLPCKFGTKIYWLRPNAKGIPAEVMEHKFDCVMIDSIDLFGRVIFLTREEAKQALKRMREVQDVN